MMLHLRMQDSKANAEKSAKYRNQKELFAETRHLIIFIYCREETIDEDKFQLLCLLAERSWQVIFKVHFTKRTFT